MWVWSLVGEMPWRRKWQLTPVFLPGKSHGQRSLGGYRGHRVAKNWKQLSNWTTKILIFRCKYTWCCILKSLSSCSSLVYRNTINFYRLTLHLETLLEWLISSQSFIFLILLVFPHRLSHVIWEKDSFLSSFTICISFLFFSAILH